MTKGSILVVDDDPAVSASLREGLEAEGWEVTEAASRAQMMAALEAGPYDAVTLDLMLGAENGLDLARSLRASRNIPVLMITGKAQPMDRVTGLEYGADDYITKPFLTREVALRIERVLDRYRRALPAPPEDNHILFDHSVFDTRSGMIEHADGTTVELTGLEQQLFSLFARHPGRVLSRDEIAQELYGRDWSPLDRSIDGHVARLRRKLEPPGEAPVLIRSVRGVGYVFTGGLSSSAPPT